MKIPKQKFLMFMPLVLAGASHAGGVLTQNQLTQVAFQTGGFFLYAPAWSNPNGCTNSDAIVLLSTDPNYDKAYALLLSAYMSGRLVSGYSDGCAEFDGRTYNTIRGHKYLLVK